MKLQSLTIDIEDLGPVLLEKSQRAKRLNISVRPYKGIRVAVPRTVSLARAKEFVQANLPWAQKNLAYVRTLEQEHQAAVDELPRVDKARAKRIITTRLACLALQHGFKYRKVFIRNQKSRWGSCSSQNNINLNVNLVGLTDELMDYVILHELVHTEILNHSPRFWGRLEEFVPNARFLDKQLNKHRLGLL